MPELNQHSVLYAPPLTPLTRIGVKGVGWTLWVDGEAPNWVAVDAQGSGILRTVVDTPMAFPELVSRYAAQHGLEIGKAWVHVQSFITEALRHQIVSLAPMARAPYQGRAKHLALSRLREAWLHTNNSCNLSCAHCLVSSSPRGAPGLPTATWRAMIEELVGLGVDRFYITGGEPFVRPDLPELIRAITETHQVELIILTNATLFAGPRRRSLDSFNRERVKFQVSLDRSTPAINDPIRGTGSLEATVAGLRELVRCDFDVTITTVVTSGNLDDLPRVTHLAESCGVRAQHLMWMHRRGTPSAARRVPPRSAASPKSTTGGFLRRNS